MWPKSKCVWKPRPIRGSFYPCFSQWEGQVWVSSVVIGLQSGLIESQISARVFPSSYCLQKDKASLVSFWITTAAVITVLFVTAYRAPTIPWLRAPVLWPATHRGRWLPFSTLGQRSRLNYPHRDSCGVSHSHQYQGYLSSHCMIGINEPAACASAVYFVCLFWFIWCVLKPV